MTENGRLERVFRMAKEQRLVLGIQLSSGSLHYGVVEQMDDEVLLLSDKKGRNTLLSRAGVVAVFVIEKGISLWMD